MVSVSYKVTGIGGTIKSMGKLIQWYDVKIPKLTLKEADAGALFAKSIAPRGKINGGALIQAIESKTSTGGATIHSRTPKGGTNPRNVPYQLFISLGRYGFLQGRPMMRTGDHNYMDTTARMLEKKYPDDVVKSISKALKEFNKN